jgi:hypothetical protein
MTEDGARSGASRAARAGGLALLVLVTVLAFRDVLELAHVGWDTYPFLVTSRVRSLADLAGVLGEPAMRGIYPHGEFWRPLTSLTFSLDQALFGSRAWGYHATDLALHVVCVFAFHALARRLLGGYGVALAASLVFAIHPVLIDTLPVSARRGETLSTLLVISTLLALPRGGATPSTGGAAVLALLTLLALGAKESAVVVVPLAFALGLLGARGVPFRERAVAGVRAAAVPLAATAVFLALRWLVLESLGGHEGTSLTAGLLRWPELAPPMARALLHPQPVASAAGLDRVFGAATAGFAALSALALATSRGGARAESSDALSPRALLAFCALWAAALLAIGRASGDVVSPWHVSAYLAPWCLFLGGAIRGLLAGGKGLDRARLAPHALLLVCTLALLPASPLVHRYEEWHVLSADVRAYSAEFQQRVRDARGGEGIHLTGLPRELSAPDGAVGVREARGISYYSMQALADLVFPGREVEVTSNPKRARDVPRGVIRVAATVD